MSPEYPVVYLARLVLETVTPLSISTGNREAAFDNLLVRDANGLPSIPGTSVAGVLRSLFDRTDHMPDCEDVFGYADGNEGQPSRVQVSWGVIHDASDQPVEGLLMDTDTERLSADPILASVTGASPILRDHVRLHHRGAGDHQGKFDRSMLHRGHRFSIEVAFWSKGPNDTEAIHDPAIWNTLLGLFMHPGFRLGGHTRRGLGVIKVVRANQSRFDLKKADDYARYASLSASLSDHSQLEPIQLESETDWLTCELTLHPEAGWRFGQGSTSFSASQQASTSSTQKAPQQLPVSEISVRWDNESGYLDQRPRVLIPASGIKGALAHRVAFHHDCQTENWASEQRCQHRPDTQQAPPPHPAVAALFGYAKDTQETDEDGTEERGRGGWLYLDDSWLEQVLDETKDLHQQWHNAIDRFTGGVRHHVLYGEELLWGNTLRVVLRIDPRGQRQDQNTKHALRCALQDLCEGRLAIGAGAGKGHGYCQGSMQWSDNGTWIGEAP